MDKGFKMILGGITLCVLLIVVKFAVFDDMNGSDALIPGVTDDSAFIRIFSNSTLGMYILNDSFMDDVVGVHIESKSELYGCNDTSGDLLFDECCDSLILNGFSEDYVRDYAVDGKYSGIFVNDTRKIVFNIFEGNDVEEATGFYLILTVYEGRR